MHSLYKHTVQDQEFTFIEVIQENIKVTFIDYGATILSIFVPDKDNNLETVLLAYDKLESYIENELYLNAIIGPSSGRIKDGKFTINSTEYQLDKNYNETENLHGGFETFAFKFFKYKVIDETNQTQVIFTYHKKYGNSLFPGTQQIRIIYTVKQGEVLIEFIGNTDKDTLLNLTNHAYFNLSGNLKRDILDNELFINSSKTLILDDKYVPFKVDSLIDTHLDFRTSKPINDNFFEGIYNLPTKGIDNAYLLDEISYEIPQAILYDPVSKRKLEVYTTYPCIVCYTHNFPDGKGLLFNKKQDKHMGICFEAQNPPNGINIAGLEDSILYKDEEYHHKIRFKFTVELN